MFRALIRYFALVCITAVYIASGLMKIVSPAVPTGLLVKSNFPRMLAMVGVHLGTNEYRYVIQATGAYFVASSLFILLGVGRGFFSFMLAMATIVITIAFHVNIENPAATSEADMQQVMKNLSIVGAFLFVAGSSRGSRRYAQARAATETSGVSQAKKRN